MDGRRERLKELFLDIKDCNDCGLCNTKTRFVFGSGNASAELLFIGEAPGKNEDLQGLPFVGRAGQILDDLLASIGLHRGQVFITNVLKCRPPKNRDPRPEEVEACKGHLFEQISIIGPKVICTLGKHSTQLILNTKKGISGLRGRVYRTEERVVLPINHPAAALYNPHKLDVLKKDFERIKTFLDKEETEKERPVKDMGQGPRQLGLF